MTEKFRTDDIREEAFSYYRRLDRVRRYCETHFAEDLPLGRVASVASLDKSYFSTFFHGKVGVTFHAWLRYLRVTKAVKLLLQSRCSITQIATRVGFNELSTFERAFRYCTGKTPAAYRQSQEQTKKP